MAADKNYGDPTTGSTAYIGLIGVLVFVLTIIYLESLYYHSEEQEHQEKVVNVALTDLARVQAEQHARLHEYGYDHAFGDDGQGRVSIPIEDAKRLLLSEWENRADESGETPPADGS